MGDEVSPQAINYLIRHVFLPPKLPQKSDATDDNQLFLVRTIARALIEFRDFATHESQDIIRVLASAVGNLKSIHDEGIAFSESKLKTALGEIHQKGIPDFFFEAD